MKREPTYRTGEYIQTAAPCLRPLRLERFRLADGRGCPHVFRMAVTLPIGRMSREDKLRAMEALWADLTQDEAETESPGWHGAVLRETEQLVREGKAKFSDWQSARRRIRRERHEREIQKHDA